MKPYIIISVLVSSLLFSCGSGVDLSNVIDTNSPLELATAKSKEIIKVDSKKWNGLIDFAIKHQKGWEETQALYIGTEIWIHQKDFSFRYYSSGEIATIKFTTNEGREHKMAKRIEKEDLAFLFENN